MVSRYQVVFGRGKGGNISNDLDRGVKDDLSSACLYDNTRIDVEVSIETHLNVMKWTLQGHGFFLGGGCVEIRISYSRQLMKILFVY